MFRVMDVNYFMKSDLFAVENILEGVFYELYQVGYGPCLLHPFK